METSSILKRLKIYQITSLLSILLTLVGFSYNVWRLEQTEINSNIRTSSFEILKELSNLEQLVYAAYYDKDSKKGNPRTGWVKVGIITDLSMIASKKNDLRTKQLHTTWKNNWHLINNNQKAVDKIIKSIDLVRHNIRFTLANLN